MFKRKNLLNIKGLACKNKNPPLNVEGFCDYLYQIKWSLHSPQAVEISVTLV